MKMEKFKASRIVEWKIGQVLREKTDEDDPETSCFFLMRIDDENEDFGCTLRYSSRMESFWLELRHFNKKGRERRQFSFNASIKLGRIEEKMDAIINERNTYFQTKGFATLDEFMNLADSNNCVTLIIELTLEREVVTETEISALQPSMLQEFDTATYSDYSFVCSDNVTIPCHRFMLVKASPWFKDTFSNLISKERCTLDSIDSKTFKEVLRYIYTGGYAISLDDKFNLEMIVAADKFGLSKLADGLVAMMKEHLTMERVLTIIKMYSCYSVSSHAQKMFERCFSFIVERYDGSMHDDINTLDHDVQQEVFDTLRASLYNIAISSVFGEPEE